MLRQNWAWLLVIVVGLSCASGWAADKLVLPLTLTVEAGSTERIDAAVQFALPKEIAQEPKLFRLYETSGVRESHIAVQRDEEEHKLWWIARGTTAAGATRTYRLEAGDSTQLFTAVDWKIADGKIGANWPRGGVVGPLFRYAQEHVVPPDGVNAKYGRSGHLHPVWTPSGAIVTDELPPDHLHQSGIFLAFTKTEFKGHEVDFWNLAGGKGRVRHSSFGRLQSEGVYGRMVMKHEHVDLTQADAAVGVGAKIGGDVALNETWEVRIWPQGIKSGYWLLDIRSDITCASAEPLKLPEYHYGGMAIRGAREWKPQHVKFLTSEGDDRLKGNHTRPRWCRISGAVEGKSAGITLMTHPSNFRYPEPLRIHPTMPYMVYTPSFLGDWEITPKAQHVSRYRFVIHDGVLPAETIERLWKDYAEPLTAVVAAPAK